MNKIILGVVALLLQGFNLFAQVNFSSELSYEQAVVEAQKSKKKIFIDFYTTWCGPCKTMDKEVFTDTQVGAYMNKEFVNLKVNAEAGDGIRLAKQFKVKAYPTFVLLNSEAEEVFRMEGARSASLFVESIQKGLDPASRPEALAKRYEAGDRTPQLINDYALDILKSGAEEKGFAVINGYFEGLSPAEKAHKDNLFLYERYSLNLNDKKISYMFANVKDFKASLGEEKVLALQYRFLRNALIPYANGYLRKNNKFDAKEYQAVVNICQKSGLPASYGLASLLKIADAQVEGNPTVVFNTMEKEFASLTKSDRFLLMMTFGEFNESRALADRATRLLNQYIPEVAPETATVLSRVLSELKEKGESIAFQSLSFQQALDLAKQQNKKVFIDCYAVWCGPCKWLDENTFRDPEIVKYFDANFVNLKIDMEKGEGIELRKKLAVNSYPTMFFIDPAGTVLHKVTGSLDSDKLMKEALSIH